MHRLNLNDPRDPLSLADLPRWGVSVWRAAAYRVDPRLYEPWYFIGMIGPLPPFTFCSPGCICEELAAAEWAGLQNLPHLGYRIDALPELPARNQQIRRMMERGLPVVWFGYGAAGILTEIPHDREYETDELTCKGRVLARTLSADSTCDYRFYAVRWRNRGLGPRRARESMAMLNSAVMAARPQGFGVCARRNVGSLTGYGESAFTALLEAVERGGSPLQAARTLSHWTEQLSVASFFLSNMARQARDRASNRIRTAGLILDYRLYPVLKQAIQMLRDSARTGDLRDTLPALHALMGEAANHLSESHALLLEGASIRAGLGPGIQNLLLSEHRQLEGMELQEALYLARGGTARMRQLAATALSGDRSPAAITCLRQLLYDSDAGVSDAALSSLQRLPAEESLPVLRAVYPHVPVSRMGSTASLRPGILAALGRLASPEDARRLAAEWPTEDPAESRAVRATLDAPAGRNPHVS